MAEGAPSRLDVAIAGAGIGGLTAAIALAQRGFTVTVYERATELQDIGAGIQLSPNAMHVLRRLGLDAAVLNAASEPEAIDIRIARTGDLLASIPLKDHCRSRYGAPYIVIHRAALMGILLVAVGGHDNIAISTGAEVTLPETRQNTVAFTVGPNRHDADLLIAADGVHSEIRRHLTGRPAADLAQTAWRAVIEAPWQEAVLPAGCTGLWLGNGVHLVHYALRRGRELNLVLISHKAAGEPRDLLAGFYDPIRQELDDADWRPWPLLAVDPAGAWTSGRIALIGDAAHSMLPTSAQGGAQAIEDAYMLAASLEKSPGDLSAAMHDWQNRRRDRVRRIAAQAADNLRIYGLSGPAAAARNMAIRALPSRLHLARLDWLYGWQPGPDTDN